VTAGFGLGSPAPVLRGVPMGVSFFLSLSGTVSPLDPGGLESDPVEGSVTGCTILEGWP